MKENHYSQPNFSPPQVARGKQCQSTPPWRHRLLTFLLLVMALAVPRQAYAGAHFGTVYAGDTYNSRISHHPTVDEPWITVYFWFYDTWGGDGYFLHDETERGHKGPAVYVDGKYICSPDWELAWSSGNGNASGLDDQRGNNGWWGSTYTNSVDGVNYTVRFWDPRKVNGQFWVEMVIYMDKMAVATEHDVKIRGKWKLNGDSSNPGGSIKFEERTFRTQAIRNIFSDSPNYERTYGSLKVTRSSLNTSYGPTTVAMTTDGSYYKDYGNGKRYFDPSTMNQAVYKTYSKGSSTYNGLTLSYNETDGSSFYLYRQKSITVTPNDRPSTIIFGWQMDMPYRYDAPCNVDATTDMWKKQILLTWQASGGLCYANGTWSIYRYPDGHPEDKTKVASDIPYNTRKYTDDVPDYDQKYVYQIYFVPTNSPSGKLLSRQMESTTQFVQRSFPINITDVVSDKKSITVKWQCPEFKGNESYAFKLLRTESKNGQPSYDADDVVGVFVGDECRGMAHPTYNARYDNSFVLLDVYGNADDAGTPLTFKVYDASTGIMYPVTTTSQPMAFSANVLVGKYADPLRIEAADKIEQATMLGAGWNWMSFYAKADDMDVRSVFADVADGVQTVKTQNVFVNCDNGTWYGKNFDVDNRSMYKVRMTNARMLKLIGSSGTQADRTITLVPGWNWIAYNNTQTASVADALAGMDPQDGDMIKGQYGFALFDGYEWTGSLKALVPGQGYMLQSASAGTRTFTYPASLAPYAPQRAAARPLLNFSPIDHHKYPSNMTITARVTFNDEVQQGAEVGVFAGDECRTAEVTDADGYAYFTVPGEGKCNLRFLMVKNGDVWLAEATVDFIEDAICGSYKQPLELTFGKTTYVDGIAVDADDNTRWFDVHGRMLNGKPTAPGVYVRSTYDTSTGLTTTRKVVVR